MNRSSAWLCAAGLVACCAGPALADCRQALALGLDVSGSVDAREYRLQMDGLAAALGSPRVRQALTMLPAAPVDLMVYEWSGPDDPAVILPWTTVANEATLEEIIAHLRATERRDASPGTAIGVAMREGASHLAARSHCWKRTLDLSGDGKSNLGPRPVDIRRDIEETDIVVNALVIGADAPTIADLRQVEIAELARYYQANVIVGADSFVEIALGFDAYGEAMARKLERELETLMFSRVVPLRRATLRSEDPG